MFSNRFKNLRNNYMSSSPSNIPSSNDLSGNSNVIENASLIQQESSANILDQISSYNSTQTDILLQEVNNEIIDQKQINNILKQKNFESNDKEISNFVKENSLKINNQLENMENLFTELTTIYEQNQILHQQQDSLLNTIDDEDTKAVASNLRKLKTLKNDILHFLYETGIRVQS